MKLPLASTAAVRRWMRATAAAHRSEFTAMMLLFGLTTLVGLIGPQLLGHLVDSVTRGTEPWRVDVLALVFLGVLVAHALLARAARYRAAVFGEAVLAETREDVIGRALRLPLGTVEAAGTGELLSRSTSDVDRLDFTVRHAAPELTAAVLTILLTAAAMIATSPLLACGMLVAVPLLVVCCRWYFPRAGRLLPRMLDAWAGVQSSIHETVQGSRTINSLQLAGRRRAHNDRAIGRAIDLERRYRGLLSVFLPTLELSYVVPIAAILLIAGWGHAAGIVDLGTATTVVLYAAALSSPIDELFSWLEELQVGHAALRRILGVREVPAPRGPDRAAGGGSGHDLVIRDVRFAYRADRQVLHGIDLQVPAGQRMVIVGPSGAGKSTLGLLVAGVHAPGSGSVAFGDVEITTLPTERVRREVVLLTQEHHVFGCSLRDNLSLPGEFGDRELLDALATVGALEWARSLPEGLDTVLGTGGHPVPAAVAQQIALARVVLADPHTLVLDEATSLLDGDSSRDVERSLSTLLAGRTVIAIAHRLHAARNADRVAVLVDGRIVELGTHAELLAAGGSYAELHAASGAAE